MRNQSSLVFFFLLPLTMCNTFVRTAHLQSSFSSEVNNVWSTIWTIIQILLFVAVIAGCIYIYWKCCRNNQNNQQVQYVPAQQPAGNQGTMPQYQPLQPQQQSTQQQQQMMFYQGQEYKPLNQAPVVNAAAPYQVEDSNPYATGSHWAIQNNTRLRQNVGIERCTLCTSKPAPGIASTVVHCSNDDVFHLGCLGSYRLTRSLQFGGNGVDQCPKCKERYSYLVKYFCEDCKLKYAEIDMLKFQSIQDTFKVIGGSKCDSCRK